MPRKLKDSEMVGRVFGRLTILSRFGTKDRWMASCSCGAIISNMNGKSLRSGDTKSCGCLQRENMSQLNKNHPTRTTHGMTKTPTYIAWKNMKARCNDEKHSAYKNYGGRGITYHPEWESFENFLKDMGEKPKGMSLDRTNVLKNYSKDNCRWVDNQTQATHRRKQENTSCVYKGVSFITKEGKYRGTLMYQGIVYHLGYSRDPLHLAKKYDQKLFELSGSYEGSNKKLGLIN